MLIERTLKIFSIQLSNTMKHIHTFESFLSSDVNEGATPRLLKSAGQNLARQVKDKKNYTVDQLKDRLLSTPVARMLSDDEILIVLDHAKEELGMNEARVAATDKIIIPTLSDIDHTRIVKWCSANGIKDCEWEKSGDGYIMDTSKMPMQDQQDLDKYLFASRLEYTREFTKK